MPNLDAFELAVARGDTEAAGNEMLAILRNIDDRYGRLDMIEAAAVTPQRRATQIATRFAAAFARLLTSEPFPFAPVVYEQLTYHHRWLELMFRVSGFGSADYLTPQLATVQRPDGSRVVPPEGLARFLLIYSAATGLSMNLDESLQTNPAATVIAALGYLATRFCYTDGAHALRERLLEWLPDKVANVSLGGVWLQQIASPYMHCSYAMRPDKHRIKAPLIAQMRRGLIEAGAPELAAAPPPAERPTIVVATENFNDGHSVHRTHAKAVTALRRDFHVVGFVYASHVSPPIEACFDEIVTWTFDGGLVAAAARHAAQVLALQPAMVLHLGVGMSPHVIALASLRLAPVQAASFGHTATTMSPAIDYMILPEDFIGDPACFSETLVGVPAHAMPYHPRTDTDYPAIRARGAEARAARAAESGAEAARPGVRIAIPASVMKLGPPFFDALGRAGLASAAPVTYEVFPLGSHGLAHLELTQRLAERLPTAVVHPELDYPDYIERLAACDFFVCPFPYGNMNSILDSVLVGLPGVCLDGPEAHAHADAAYFKRMNFPPALTTASVDDYVAAIVRLASDARWRARCQKAAADADLDAAFFAGDPGLFVDAVKALLDAAPATAAAPAGAPARAAG
jgi:hypothetical protein